MAYKPDLNTYWLDMVADMAGQFNTGALTQIAGAAAQFAGLLGQHADDNASNKTAKALYHEAAKFRALADACNAMIVLQTVNVPEPEQGQTLTFAHMEQTGMTKMEILERAADLQRAMEKRFGKGEGGTLQSCVDAVIDGAIERNQGN